MPMNAVSIEQAVTSCRAILESLTPRGLAVEFTRALGEPPPDASTSGDTIQRMLITVREEFESGSGTKRQTTNDY